MILSFHRNNIVNPFFSWHYSNSSKTWLIPTPKELVDGIIPLDQTSWSFSLSCLLDTAKVNFRPCKHFNNFISSTTECFNIYSPRRIQLLLAGLPPWPGVACTNNSSIFDTAFIQYWSINFYSWIPFLAQTNYRPSKQYFYLRHHLTRKHIKQKQFAACQALHQYQKQGKGFKLPNTRLMPEPC